MKSLLLFLFIAIAIFSCNQDTKPMQALAAQEEASSTSVSLRQEDPVSTDTDLQEWKVDLIWQGRKIIGGGPFPAVDTIYLHIEDANVSIYSKSRPTIDEVKKQAKPPVAGYSLLGMQGKPQMVGLPER